MLVIQSSLVASWIPVLNTSRSPVSINFPFYLSFLTMPGIKAAGQLISFPGRFSLIQKPSLILKLHFWALHFLILAQPYYQQTVLFLLRMSSPTLAEIESILTSLPAKRIFELTYTLNGLQATQHITGGTLPARSLKFVKMSL